MGSLLHSGPWISYGGVATLLLGLSWDALLHGADPTLAAREGIFTIGNPSHLLLGVGLALAVLGTLLWLCERALELRRQSGERLAVVLLPAGVLVALSLGAFVVAGPSSVLGGPQHVHDDGVVHGHVEHQRFLERQQGMSVADHHSDPAAVPTETGWAGAIMSSVGAMLDEGKYWFQRGYFALFPGKLEDELASLNIGEVVRDDEELRGWLRLAGTSKLMAKLVAGSGAADCHQGSHRLGRAAYDLYGDLVFRYADSSCATGYYHGAMEAFLQDKGTAELGSTITQMCESLGTRFEQFACLHGIGHGVMAFHRYDLPKALQTCRLLPSYFALRSCYGGMFMENIVLGSGQGLLAGYPTQWVSDDPHFPCNAVTPLDEWDAVLEECYKIQTARMLILSRSDFLPVVDECTRAPERAVTSCFQSVGRDSYQFRMADATTADENEGRTRRKTRGRTPLVLRARLTVGPGRPRGHDRLSPP